MKTVDSVFTHLRNILDEKVYDRITQSMNFQEGDRVPIWDYLDNIDIYKHFASETDSYAEGMVKVYHGLGIDLCRGYGASFSEEDNGKVIDNGNVETTVLGRTRWVSRYPITSLDDLKNYSPQPISDDWVRDQWIPNVRKQQELFAPYTMYVPGTGCGFHATYGLMGLQVFSLAIYEAREHIDRVMNVLCENSVKMAQAAADEKLCPLFFIGDDIAYKGATMFSPNFLRETFISCLHRVCEPLNKAGIKVIFHSDGNVMAILDDMIAAGIDGLNPIEPIAGMDIGLLKKKYYGRLILVGNIDCSQVLPLGTKEGVIEATKECLRTASPGGGHFIGSSSEIVPSTPVENILAFYETCREYGRYPIKV